MGLAQPEAGVVVEDVSLYFAALEPLHNKINRGDFNNKQLSSQLVLITFDGQPALPLPLGVVLGRHVGGVTLRRLGCVLFVLVEKRLTLEASELVGVLVDTGVWLVPGLLGTSELLVVAPLDDPVKFRLLILLEDQFEPRFRGRPLVLRDPALADVSLGPDDCREVPLDRLSVKDGLIVLELHPVLEEVVDASQQELGYHPQ